MTTAIAPITTLAVDAGRPDSANVFIAPRRFDVHTIDAVLRWADEALAGRSDLLLDLRMVDFMDNHMKATLDTIEARALAAGHRMTFAEISPAAALTFELMDRVAA